MTSWRHLSVSLALPYPQADIVFHLRGACREGTAPTVEITAVSCETERALSLQDDAVPVLEDFASGFARWLRTCRIDAEVTAQAIHGHMSADATPAQLLLALQHACAMIEQRFSLYTESIVS